MNIFPGYYTHAYAYFTLSIIFLVWLIKVWPLHPYLIHQQSRPFWSRKIEGKSYGCSKIIWRWTEKEAVRNKGQNILICIIFINFLKMNWGSVYSNFLIVFSFSLFFGFIISFYYLDLSSGSYWGVSTHHQWCYFIDSFKRSVNIVDNISCWIMFVKSWFFLMFALSKDQKYLL